MNKIFVLDTNILLYDAESIFSFLDNTLIIPLIVIEELDRFKNRDGEIGYNARKVSRYIDELRLKGSLSEGIKLESNNGLLKVEIDVPKILELDYSKNDNKILSIAYFYTEQYKNKQNVVLVTKDLNLRITANSLGIESEDYLKDKIKDDLYTGHSEVTISSDNIDIFYQTGKILPESKDINFIENQYLTLKDESSQKSALARYKNGFFIKLKTDECFGIKPLNREQKFAIDLLLDDSIQVCTIVGKSGTGKNLLSLAVALQKVLEDRKYIRLLVARSTIPMGRDLGFLPGSIEEKLIPWHQASIDNLEYLLQGSFKVDSEIDYLLDKGKIKLESLSHIRGRSIAKQYILLDETQNLTVHEIRTILTRIGKGSKVVCIGDPTQIDNIYLNETNNGLSHIITKLKNQKLYGHVTLCKSERSSVAEICSELL